MKDIGVGIIGWGFMGRTHTHAMKAIAMLYPGANFRIVPRCVCTRRPDIAREACECAGFESWTDNWKEIISRKDIDVLSICTPNALHEEMIVEAARCGKHLYIDKPLTTDLQSAHRIYEAVKEAGVMASIAYNNRFLPATMRAKQLVDEGKVGETICFSARYLHSGSIDPNKPMGWKQGVQGGVILDLASHALDLITWLSGWPTEVMCVTRKLYDSRPTREGTREENLGEDQAIMLLKMENGAIGSVEASKIATGSDDELELEIRGNRGAIKFNAMNPSYLEFFDNTALEAALGGDRGFVRISTVGRYPEEYIAPKNAIGWLNGHIHSYYSFLRAVADGGDVPCPLEEAVKLQRLMDCLRESAQTGHWIKI